MIGIIAEALPGSLIGGLLGIAIVKNFIILNTTQKNIAILVGWFLGSIGVLFSRNIVENYGDFAALYVLIPAVLGVLSTAIVFSKQMQKSDNSIKLNKTTNVQKKQLSYCFSCGNPTNINDKFCNNCGIKKD